MPVRRLSGPEPIVSPADVPGDHDGNDATIEGCIAAVQASIDGPTGWLSRSLGSQTLEMTTDRFSRIMRLPYEPVTDVTSVVYRDVDGVEQTIDQGDYRVAGGNRLQFGTGFVFPAVECAADAVTITYEAGYADEDMPASAKQAVIIGVQQIKTMSAQNLSLRSEAVEGIGTTTYTVSEAASELVKRVTDALLQPLRVYWL